MHRNHYLKSCLLFCVLCGSTAARAAEGIAQSHFFTNPAGVKIHYLEQGAGTPVVLIHGWLSSARMNWANPGIIGALAQRHLVVALDLPGYGRSDKPDDPGAYGNAWVEDVIQLMNLKGIAKAHILGYSMGSIVALKLIVLHPDRAITGVLGGMGYLPEGSDLQKTWAARTDLASKSVAELALTPSEVKSVAVPMEMVVGASDPVNRTYVEALLQVRRDWPLVNIPGDGHIGAVTDPVFTQKLVDWVDGGQSGRSVQQNPSTPPGRGRIRDRIKARLPENPQ